MVEVDLACAGGQLIGLVDFGSTFTKFRAVTLDGRLVGSAEHLTVHHDVLEGLEAAREQVGRSDVFGRFRACSSAGGGLRMAVVGLERELTVEAARQAALSAGARITTVESNGVLDAAGALAVLARAPDIVLLVGGTNGGDHATLHRSARAFAGVAGGRVPIVVAGNEEAQQQVSTILREAGWMVTTAPNVMPAIRQISPDGVREVLRRLFISHVIGGKLAGSGERLVRLVQMATPDAVLQGAELLSRELAARHGCSGLIVVDVGGATTDVHSVLADVQGPRGYKPSLLPQSRSARSVEADLGIRWNATGIVDAAASERLIDTEEAAALSAPAAARERDPLYRARTKPELAVDRQLTKLAITIALRRHAGRERLRLTTGGTVLERDGRDLTESSLVVGTGGAVQMLTCQDLEGCVTTARGGEARLLPHRTVGAMDERYVLSAAGLLAFESEQAASALLRSCLPDLF
jgi:uncharacterized protein (TIGR01319 family)